MTVHVTLHQIRILMDYLSPSSDAPTLKICANQQIFKFRDIAWNSLCHRWEHPTDIQLQLRKLEHIQLQLYTRKSRQVEILGESVIDLSRLNGNFGGEIKNCLKVNGKVVGWIYCQISLSNETKKINSQYLYIHKLTFDLLEIHNNGTVEILLNDKKLSSKNFLLTNKKRIIFPNVKTQSKKSDCWIIQLYFKDVEMLPIRFLLDEITCGETTTLKLWIRNKKKIKIGQIQIQYFLDSAHLPNKDKELIQKYFQPKGSFHSLSVTKASHGKVSIMTRQGSWLNNSSHVAFNVPGNNLKQSILSFKNLKVKQERINRTSDMGVNSQIKEFISMFPKIL